jgi:hypothetical protein
VSALICFSKFEAVTCLLRIRLSNERRSASSCLVIPHPLYIIVSPEPVMLGLHGPVVFAGPVDWHRAETATNKHTATDLIGLCYHFLSSLGSSLTGLLY